MEAPMAGGNQGAGNEPNDISPPGPPPGTDMTGICFRDQLWLNTYPLDRNFVFEYFALSQFYDPTCNNELLRSQSIHPLDITHLSKMTGSEYMLSDVREPNLFVLRKQNRDGPEKVTPQLTYYILDGSIYQAPQLCNVFYSRIGRTLHHLSQGLKTVASKLEKINSDDSDEEGVDEELTTVQEPINVKELKRVDHILTSLLHKLPPAPPPPDFARGYAPPPSTLEEREKVKDESKLSNDTLFCSDPILNQGPSKRMKF